MAAYLIFNEQVLDQELFDAYRILSSRAVEEFGAVPIIRGGAMTVLEGEWMPRIVIFQFRDVVHAQAFYDSATYQEGLSIRQRAALARVAIVEGVE